MNKVLFILFFFVLITGCSLNTELRKKKRAVRKIEAAKRIYPKLFKPDTITIHDTIVVEKHVKDTITRIEFHDTTTVINNDRLILKYFYDTLRQEIYHEAECKEKVRVIKKEIPIIRHQGLTLMDKFQLNIIPVLIFLAFLYLIWKRR